MNKLANECTADRAIVANERNERTCFERMHDGKTVFDMLQLTAVEDWTASVFYTLARTLRHSRPTK
jgi:hypothetical protein